MSVFWLKERMYIWFKNGRQRETGWDMFIWIISMSSFLKVFYYLMTDSHKNTKKYSFDFWLVSFYGELTKLLLEFITQSRFIGTHKKFDKLKSNSDQSIWGTKENVVLINNCCISYLFLYLDTLSSCNIRTQWYETIIQP